MNDPGEEICDALVEFISGLTPSNGCLTADVHKTDNPLAEIEHEVAGLTVLLHAAAERADKIGRGGQCFEQYVISMLVVRKLDDEFTGAVLNNYVREIKAAVRGQRMAGRVWSVDETVVRFDPQIRKDLSQFCSVVQFTYSEAG